MTDLNLYLAQKYLSGPKADAIIAKSDKKRKRKSKHESVASSSGGMIIDDDEDSTWTKSQREEEEEDRPVVETSSFRPQSKSSWTKIREASPSFQEEIPQDEQPQIIEDSEMSGGIVSSSFLDAQRREREAEREALERERSKTPSDDEPGETVYRDKSGRKIDTKMEKAKLARKRAADLEKEMKKMEWGKGLVQREDAEKRKLEEEKMKHAPLARYADDQQLNEEQKDVERWNDPAAKFLTSKKKSGSDKFPKYKGPPPPPNRFGILPGYRWDGVDRSNGFEREYFQKINERQRRNAEGYKWSTSFD